MTIHLMPARDVIQDPIFFLDAIETLESRSNFVRLCLSVQCLHFTTHMQKYSQLRTAFFSLS